MQQFHGYGAHDRRPRPPISPAARSTLHVAIIGLGAMGRLVAHHVANIGVHRMTLFDPAEITAEHVRQNILDHTNIGQSKVAVVSAEVQRLHPEIEVKAVALSFPQVAMPLEVDAPHAAFVCGHGIDQRQVWINLPQVTCLMIDGWIDADDIRIVAARRSCVEEQLYDEVYPPGECAGQSLSSLHGSYAASIAAGLMSAQFQRWLRGRPLQPFQHLQL